MRTNAGRYNAPIRSAAQSDRANRGSKFSSIRENLACPQHRNESKNSMHTKLVLNAKYVI